MRSRDVDLASGRLRVGEAKTDAGVREVELLPALRDELAEHKGRVGDARPEALVFPTSKGGRQTATNVRKRVLGKAVEKADERLAKEDASPLPERLTPHYLRRTFASLLFALGRTAPEVMDQLGHTDPKLARRIYARALRRDVGEDLRLRALVNGVDEPRRVPDQPQAARSKPTTAFKIASRSTRRSPTPTPAAPSTPVSSSACSPARWRSAESMT